MTPTQPAPRLMPELRISTFYFSMFMSSGAATVFGGIWFAQKGLSTEQIGVINSAPILVLLAVGLWIGRIADRAPDWRQAIVIGAVLAGVIPFGLYLVDGFWGILLVWTLAAVAQASIIPVLDAAAMRLSRRRGSDFGAIRAWGTIGYLLVIFATGYLVHWYGPALFVPLFIGTCLIRSAAAFWLPPFRARPEERVAPSGATKLLQVMKPWFLLPLVGWAMVYATHLILNAFQGLLWQRQGISVETIGVLITLGAVSEAVMFFAFRRLVGRFPARSLILLSAVVSAARWAAMGYSPGVAVLAAMQLLHAVTYAIGFLGCVQFITNWTSEDIAAEAQSFFMTLQQAMAVVALIGFGWFADLWGAQAYLASAGFAAVGAALIWLSRLMQGPKAN